MNNFFLLWNKNVNILKNVGNKTNLVTKNTDISQKIFHISQIKVAQVWNDIRVNHLFLKWYYWIATKGL